MDGLYLPYGRPEYVSVTDDGVRLGSELILALDLQPSEAASLEGFLGRAYESYEQLEMQHADITRSGNTVEVTISRFESEATEFLQQVWSDLEDILDERREHLARYHLPLGRLFGSFHLGRPNVGVTIEEDEKNGAFSYKATFQWPPGSGKAGGQLSGRTTTLPPEFQRYWDAAGPGG
jgi:hypothetical protein